MEKCVFHQEKLSDVYVYIFIYDCLFCNRQMRVLCVGGDGGGRLLV